MKRIVLTFVLLMAFPGKACFGIEFERFHSQDEISNYLREIASANSDIATLTVLGTSTEGREVAYLKLGSPKQKKPVRVYLNGTHHGNELSSTETVLAVIEHLIRNRKSSAITRLLSTHEIYLQPLVNPDGHAAGTRGDSLGRDPNRDYPVPGASESEEQGEASGFQLPETRFVKQILDRTSFDGAIAYHSGMEGVLWPWCHSPLPTPHQVRYRALAQHVAAAMNMSMYKQSWQDYPTRGEFADYAYFKHGTLGITLEVSSEPAPDTASLNRILSRAVKGTLAYIRGLSSKAVAGMSPAFDEWGPFQTFAIKSHKLSGVAGEFYQDSQDALDVLPVHH